MDITSGRGLSCLGHGEGIILSVIDRKVAAASQKRHLETAGDDDACLRDMGDGRKDGVEIEGQLAVGN